MGERLKKLRRSKDLTQQEFANIIGSKRNTVATYEMGRTEPSAAVVSLICREFNVNEKWLRTGEGEPFVPAPSGSLDALIKEYRLDELDREIISEFAKLDEKAREAVKLYIKNVSRRLYLSQGEDPPAPFMDTGKDIPVPATAPDIMSELAELKRQNQELAAKVAAMEQEDIALGLWDGSSVSPSASAGSYNPSRSAKK